MIKNERGFTIMELLVVIVIIGVLAAIGVPAYNNMTTRARETACDANKRTIATAVGMYYVDNGSYKNGEADLTLGDLVPYLDNAESIKCPGKDAEGYKISTTGDPVNTVVVTCNVSGHEHVYVLGSAPED